MGGAEAEQRRGSSGWGASSGRAGAADRKLRTAQPVSAHTLGGCLRVSLPAAAASESAGSRFRVGRSAGSRRSVGAASAARVAGAFQEGQGTR